MCVLCVGVQCRGERVVCDIRVFCCPLELVFRSIVAPPALLVWPVGSSSEWVAYCWLYIDPRILHTHTNTYTMVSRLGLSEVYIFA